jgi:hypothetical protein
MRASRLAFATLREVPADASSVHERILRRAGFVRKAGAGVYFFLPLGADVLRRAAKLLEEQCEAAGFHPVITPLAEPVQAVFESARSHVRSWRSLPLRWYTMNQVTPRGCGAARRLAGDAREPALADVVFRRGCVVRNESMKLMTHTCPWLAGRWERKCLRARAMDGRCWRW